MILSEFPARWHYIRRPLSYKVRKKSRPPRLSIAEHFHGRPSRWRLVYSLYIYGIRVMLDDIRRRAAAAGRDASGTAKSAVSIMTGSSRDAIFTVNSMLCDSESMLAVARTTTTRRWLSHWKTPAGWLSLDPEITIHIFHHRSFSCSPRRILPLCTPL